jgi:hypothetical protein
MKPPQEVSGSFASGQNTNNNERISSSSTQ